jgi:hypothetical protein
MAKPNLHLQIPKPCSENFSGMPVQGEGRFCAVCNKCVIDFSHKTDRELLEFFKQKPKDSCGFFRPDQLNRKIMLPAQTPVIWWKALVLSAFAALTVRSAQAGTPISEISSENSETGKPAASIGKTLTISGVVKNQQGEPLQEAFISYKGKSGFVAFTNNAGRFSFKVPVNQFRTGKLQLKISRTGYFSYPITLRQPKSYNLTVLLKADSNATPPVLPVVQISWEVPLVGGGEYISKWDFRNDGFCQDSIPPKKLKFFPRIWQEIKTGFKKKEI